MSQLALCIFAAIDFNRLNSENAATSADRIFQSAKGLAVVGQNQKE